MLSPDPSPLLFDDATAKQKAAELTGTFGSGIEDFVQAWPARALGDAREWAARHGAAVLATGSVYLVGDLLEHREDRAETQESGARRRRAAT